MLEVFFGFMINVVGFTVGAMTIRMISLGSVSYAAIARFPYATALLGLVEIFAIIFLVIRFLKG